MKVSYNWLQTYFKDPLPTPEKLSELFTFRFAEVESIDAVGVDAVLDVKVLPDRAHYALCHKGIAMEVAAITGASIIVPSFAPTIARDKNVSVRVENESLCTRYTARYLENVTVGESPQWLKERLVSIGQRPINVIVDAANFIMFDMGQPLHAFDADKVQGSIVVRMANAGETMTTLDGKAVTLGADILVIADDAGPLAIAGIKGGTRAQVDGTTKRIILEAANFDPAYIRAASGRIGIRTDASKRYENEITSAWASFGSDLCAALIGELSPGSTIGILTDLYPNKTETRTLSFDSTFAARMLGVAIDTPEVIRILSLLGIAAVSEGEMLSLAIPAERLDLVLPEDIAEEIGRIYGYENIPPLAPPKLSHSIKILKTMYYEEKIRDALVALGFSEIFTYSFTDAGVVEIEKSLASDKNFLRANLSGNMTEALERNAHYVDLLNLDDVKIFEIGKVFDHNGEHLSLALGVRKIKKEKGITAQMIAEAAFLQLKEVFGELFSSGVTGLEGGMVAIGELALDALIAKAAEPSSWNLAPYVQQNSTYKKISAYPFIVRDIALFVPVETKQEDIAAVLKGQSGELLSTMRLFDIFTKTFPDGTQKTSYAFRLVFQSYEKTLADEDINPIMERVNAAVAAKGWEVR
jgi:phenylalanyl-tRNA synthetase beta chain